MKYAAFGNIARIFCGSIGGLYKYKSLSYLRSFFKERFGLPERHTKYCFRWTYVAEKMWELLRQERIDEFFTLILSIDYIMAERGCSKREASEYIDIIFKRFNDILSKYNFYIDKKANRYILKYRDFILIGSGGFADVYYKPDSGLVVKTLREEFYNNSGVVHRFRREYEITKSLSDIDGIIRVYEYNGRNHSYTMEKADRTLEEYIEETALSVQDKFDLITEILTIMKKVHERKIVHRDISYNNILIVDGRVKISDFGLGKNLNAIYSHQTYSTQGYGHPFFCAPEQLERLHDGDERSDVYALGRIINFIMTDDIEDNNHALHEISIKAISPPDLRYQNAGEMLEAAKISISVYNRNEKIKQLNNKIRMGNYDIEVLDYINTLTGEELCEGIIANTSLPIGILKLMSISQLNADNIMRRISGAYKQFCSIRDYSSTDAILNFAKAVFNGNYSAISRQEAAYIINYIAHDMRNPKARMIIEELTKGILDPRIKDILQSKL